MILKILREGIKLKKKNIEKGYIVSIDSYILMMDYSLDVFQE